MSVPPLPPPSPFKIARALTAAPAGGASLNVSVVPATVHPLG